jgi:hypothetical protein
LETILGLNKSLKEYIRSSEPTTTFQTPVAAMMIQTPHPAHILVGATSQGLYSLSTSEFASVLTERQSRLPCRIFILPQANSSFKDWHIYTREFSAISPRDVIPSCGIASRLGRALMRRGSDLSSSKKFPPDSQLGSALPPTCTLTGQLLPPESTLLVPWQTIYRHVIFQQTVVPAGESSGQTHLALW